jgi:hypothetical protein
MVSSDRLDKFEVTTDVSTVLATVVDLCKKKPGKVYDFPKDQEIYAATKIALAGTSASASGSATPTSSNTPSNSTSSALSRGVIAGIILGALVGIAVILGAILLLLRRKKNKNRSAAIPVWREFSGTAYTGPGNYEYNPMGQSGKEQYAYQPTGVEHASTRAELEGQVTPNELSAGNLSPSRRY